MSALSLIVGIIIGAAVASFAWFLGVAAKRKKLDGERRAREEVMASIGELLADADAYEASYRCGTLTAERFSSGLIDRVNAISRPLRTNMHILDVFFVKYAEQQVDEYMRMIENPERRAEARKAIRAAASEGKEEADNETRFGLGAEPAAAAFAGDETADAIAEEQDIFDTGVEREETFAPPPAAAVADVDEDAFELPAAESAAAEVVFEDVEAEETPPEEQVFGESAASGAPGSAAGDSWLEKSLEEFEAGFARFETQETAEGPSTTEEAEAEPEQAERSAEAGSETGGFVVSGQTETPEPAAEEQEPEPEPEYEPEPEFEPESESEEEDVFDIQAPPAAHERTETQQFDKPLMTEAAEDYAAPAAEDEPPSEEAAPKPKAEPAAEHDGITGDDVSDAIDNFFKIK